MTALNKQKLADIRRAAIAVARDGRTDDEWFYYLQCVHHKNVLAMLDELEAAEKRIAEHNFENRLLANADRDIKALRQRIAELEVRTVTVKLPSDYRNDDGSINADMFNTCAVVGAFREALRAAGIGVKGE